MSPGGVQAKGQARKRAESVQIGLGGLNHLLVILLERYSDFRPVPLEPVGHVFGVRRLKEENLRCQIPKRVYC